MLTSVPAPRRGENPGVEDRVGAARIDDGHTEVPNGSTAQEEVRRSSTRPVRLSDETRLAAAQ